eukprot:7093766-Lingulodinium_polyedra.AAC.1
MSLADSSVCIASMSGSFTADICFRRYLQEATVVPAVDSNVLLDFCTFLKTVFHAGTGCATPPSTT